MRAEEDFETLAGFVLARFGQIPQTGDHFEWDGLRFEIVDMDGRRIDRILVSPAEPVAPPHRSRPNGYAR